MLKKFRRLLKKFFGLVWLWMLAKYPPLTTAFDQRMARLAGAMLLVALALVIYLLLACAPAMAVVNVVGLCLLAMSIPLSLIRGRNNWKWPTLLALIGGLLWATSIALGPRGLREVPDFFRQLAQFTCSS